MLFIVPEVRLTFPVTEIVPVPGVKVPVVRVRLWLLVTFSVPPPALSVPPPTPHVTSPPVTERVPLFVVRFPPLSTRAAALFVEPFPRDVVALVIVSVPPTTSVPTPPLWKFAAHPMLASPVVVRVPVVIGKVAPDEDVKVPVMIVEVEELRLPPDRVMAWETVTAKPDVLRLPP
jgi:hypothetical protein